MPRSPSLASILNGSMSESFRRLNGSIFPSANVAVPVAQVKRIRQSAAPVLNKLETRFHAQLLQDCMESGGQTIHCQAVRLELARGIWYKPDFFVPEAREFYEVKGPRAFRGGFENLKVAARVHKWAKFFLVWEDGGDWKRQEIFP